MPGGASSAAVGNSSRAGCGSPPPSHLLVAVVYGALVVVVGVSPFEVVPALDVLEDGLGELLAGFPSVSVQQFGLESGEERLDDRVVIGVTDASH